jgi:hypothetical protein
MKVRCAVCGHEAIVVVPYDWNHAGGKVPDVWVCDVHQKDWIA